MTRIFRSILLLMLLPPPLPASGQDLRIALTAEPSTLDPLFANLLNTNLLRAHVFDRLAHVDGKGALIPGLAESWTPISDTVWEYRLRPGVMFHDGTPLTSDDVVFSIDRADKVPGSPASFASFTRGITQVEITGPLTFRVHTKETDAYVPRNLTAIAIMARHAAEGRSTQDFNTGAAAIGSGPYRFVSWQRGAAIKLARNEAWWGPRPHWASVTFRTFGVPATREIALLTGEVDMIQGMPREDAERMAGEPNVRLAREAPTGAALLSMDQFRDNPPFMTDTDGHPLSRNPFMDRRVRLAVSKAIDREAVVNGIMAGIAVPAGQLVPEIGFGFSPRVKVERYDPDGARALLAEAGYPNGFRVTLHAVGDGAAPGPVAQVIAQLLSRVGIRAAVEAPPSTVFFPRYARQEFSFALFSWLGSEMATTLRTTLATGDASRGWGASNRGGYSNPAMDRLLVRAQATLDDPARAAILAEASEVAMADAGAIPVFHVVPLWGTRRTLIFDTSLPAQSLAANVRPARENE